jgi:hypothetical protein
MGDREKEYSVKDKQEAAELLSILKIRFLENGKRHPSIRWEDVEARLLGDGNALSVLARMEETGGEPDVLEWGGSQGDISYAARGFRGVIGL